MKVTGTATVEACAGQYHMTITGLVSPNVSEVMLGIGFLNQERAIWNFNVGEVVLRGYRHSTGRQSWRRRVIVQNDTVVPGESEMDLLTLVQYSDLSGPKNNQLVSWVTGPFSGIPLLTNFLSFHHYTINTELHTESSHKSLIFQNDLCWS